MEPQHGLSAPAAPGGTRQPDLRGTGDGGTASGHRTKGSAQRGDAVLQAVTLSQEAQTMTPEQLQETPRTAPTTESRQSQTDKKLNHIIKAEERKPHTDNLRLGPPGGPSAADVAPPGGFPFAPEVW